MELMFGILNKYKYLSQLKKNMFSGALTSGANAVFPIVTYPIYLNYLGTDKYGFWVTISVILAFGQLGELGISTAIIKYVAGEYGKRNFKAITEYISTSFYILMLTSLIFICILAFFSLQIAEFLKIKDIFIYEGGNLIFFVGVLSAFSFFVNVMRGAVAGIGRLDICNYVSIFSKIVQIILVVGLLMNGYGVWSLYFGFLLNFFLSLVLYVFVLKYIYHIKVFKPAAFKIQKLKELFKFGGTLITGNIACMLVMPFNKVIIAKFIGLSEVTYYEIAIKISGAIRDLYVKTLEPILPKISEVYGKATESLKSVFNIRKKSIRFIVLSASPLFLLIFIFTNPILRIWLGNNFDIEIAIALRILLIGRFINLLVVPDFFMFIGIGKVKYSVGEEWIRSIVNVLVIMIIVFLSMNVTLRGVVIINMISIAAGVIFLKYKYFLFSHNYYS